MNHCSTSIAAKVYCASARIALDNGELAEFTTVANKILTDHMAILNGEDWIAYCLVLLYGTLETTQGDLMRIFYRLPGNYRQVHSKLIIGSLIAIEDGNLPRLRNLLQTEHIPARFKMYLWEVTISRMKANFERAYREFPSRFHDSLNVMG